MSDKKKEVFEHRFSQRRRSPEFLQDINVEDYLKSVGKQIDRSWETSEKPFYPSWKELNEWSVKLP